MCKKNKEDDLGCIKRRGFTTRHDSRIFVEPFDFLHVFSGIDFFKLYLDKILEQVILDRGKFSTVVTEITKSYPFMNKTNQSER